MAGQHQQIDQALGPSVALLLKQEGQLTQVLGVAQRMPTGPLAVGRPPVMNERTDTGAQQTEGVERLFASPLPRPHVVLALRCTTAALRRGPCCTGALPLRETFLGAAPRRCRGFPVPGTRCSVISYRVGGRSSTTEATGSGTWHTSHWRQPLCGATVAERQARGRIREGLWHDGRAEAGPGRILRLLH